MNNKTILVSILCATLLAPFGSAHHSGGAAESDFNGSAGTMACFGSGVTSGASASPSLGSLVLSIREYGHVDLSAIGTNTQPTGLGSACTFDLSVDTANVRWQGLNPSGTISHVQDANPLGCTALPGASCSDSVHFDWHRVVEYNVSEGRYVAYTTGFEVDYCLTATPAAAPLMAVTQCGVFRYVDPPLVEAGITIGPDGSVVVS